MDTVSRGKRPTIRLCPKCRAALLRPLQLRPPINPADLLRAPSKDMARAEVVDAKAERVRRRNERKAEKRALRVTLKREGVAGMAKLYITTQALDHAPADEDCPDCLALNRRVA